MDTVIKFVDGIRVYFLTAIDVKLKFAFSLPYAKLTSSVTVDFFQKLQSVYPIPITTVQTDNGLEFLGDFTSTWKNNIFHMFLSIQDVARSMEPLRDLTEPYRKIVLILTFTFSMIPNYSLPNSWIICYSTIHKEYTNPWD